MNTPTNPFFLTGSLAAQTVAERNGKPNPRHPQVISGEIRSFAERITTRSDRIRHPEDALVADVHDSMRISELLDELDSALLEQQLTASLGGKR